MSSTRLLLQCVLLVLFASRCTCLANLSVYQSFLNFFRTPINSKPVAQDPPNASKVTEDPNIPFEYCGKLDPYSDFLFARLVQDLRFVTVLYIPSPDYDKWAANLVNFFDILCAPESTSGFSVEHFGLIAQQYRAKFTDNTELKSAAKYDPKDNKVVRGTTKQILAMIIGKDFGCNHLVEVLVTMFKGYHENDSQTGRENKYKGDIGFKNKLRATMAMLIKSCAPKQAKDQVKRTCMNSKWNFWCGVILGSLVTGLILVGGYLFFKPASPLSSPNVSSNETPVVPLKDFQIPLSTMILIVLVIITIALGLIIWYQHKYHNTGTKSTTNSKTKKHKDKGSKHTKKKKIKKEDELLSSSASSRASEISSMKVYVLKKSAKRAKSAKSAKRKSPKQSASLVSSVPLSAPTVMYAPSDYQNLFHLTKVKPKPKGTKRTIANNNKVDKNRKLIVKALSPKPTGTSGSNQQSTDSGLTSAVLKVPSVIPSTLVSTMADKNNKKTKIKKQNNESITKRG